MRQVLLRPRCLRRVSGRHAVEKRGRDRGLSLLLQPEAFLFENPSNLEMPRMQKTILRQSWNHFRGFTDSTGKVDDGSLANRELQERRQLLGDSP